MSHATAAGSALRSLLGAEAARQFTASGWSTESRRGRLSASAMRLLERELLGFRVRDLVGRAHGAQVWFETLDGGFRTQQPASTQETLDLYDSGMTVYLPGAATAPLVQWQTRLARELGHPTTHLTFSLFASRQSAHTRCHFDHLENFTIQLRGRKVCASRPMTTSRRLRRIG